MYIHIIIIYRVVPLIDATYFETIISCLFSLFIIKTQESNVGYILFTHAILEVFRIFHGFVKYLESYSNYFSHCNEIVTLIKTITDNVLIMLEKLNKN